MPFRKKRNALSKLFDTDHETKPFGQLHGDIKTWRNPYDEGYSTTYARQIHFEPGITVLVGCNGCGKTTLLRNIKNCCDKNNVAYLSYDNLNEGGKHSFGSALFYNQTSLAANLWCSSEGECISQNIGLFAKDIGEAMYEDFKEAQEVWILLDGVDSGFSIDNIEELKQLFTLILSDQTGKDIYIIAAANEYELAKDMQCLDTMTGKHIAFHNYDEYRSFILKSRTKKDKRIEKAKQKQLMQNENMEE